LENYGLIITQRSINRLENRLAKVENQLTELKDTMSDIQVLLQQILTKLNDMEKKTSRRRLSPNGSDDDKYRADYPSKKAKRRNDQYPTLPFSSGIKSVLEESEQERSNQI
jgi:uncharacterized coiled-coil protein SlyX